MIVTTTPATTPLLLFELLEELLAVRIKDKGNNNKKVENAVILNKFPTLNTTVKPVLSRQSSLGTENSFQYLL